MKFGFLKEIVEISEALIDSYRSQLSFSGLFFDPHEVRKKNLSSLEEFNKRYPEIICNGHITDFQGYIQFKDGLIQRCLLGEGYKFKSMLLRIEANSD